MPHVRLLLVPTALAALCVALAGCSLSVSAPGSDPSAASSPSAAPRPATSAASHAEPSAAPSAAPAADSSELSDLPDACPTKEVVSADLGITVGYPAVTPEDTTLGCAYTAGSETVSINFSTEETLTPEQAKAQLQAAGTTSAFQSVPGVGDAAFFDNASGGSYLAVLSGKLSFQVVTGAPASIDALTQLARDILSY